MKKIALFLVANLLFVNCLLAQIKPLKFGLVLKFDEASFDIKERKITKYLFDTIAITLDKKLDSISKTKSMCIDYVGYKDVSKATLLYVVHFYNGDYEGIKNVLIMDRFLMDNITKDTIKLGRLKGAWLGESQAQEQYSTKTNMEFLEKHRIWITNQVAQELILWILDNYFPNCQEVLDYKRQKVSDKALIFLSYETIVGKNIDKKNIKILDTFVNNQLVTRQLRDQKKLQDKQFIFYPYNKETRKIVPDITIQLYLEEDGKGNYEIKMEVRGKNANFKNPYGGEMEKSMIFNKKRFDSEDYTELVYKLNRFIGDVHTYNILW